VELVAVGCEEAIAKVEDRFPDRLLVGGLWDSAVTQKVLLQDNEFVGADLECAENVGFLLLCGGHSREVVVVGDLHLGHLGRLPWLAENREWRERLSRRAWFF
jgi:hypothetical protein